VPQSRQKFCREDFGIGGVDDDPAVDVSVTAEAFGHTEDLLVVGVFIALVDQAVEEHWDPAPTQDRQPGGAGWLAAICHWRLDPGWEASPGRMCREARQLDR